MDTALVADTVAQPPASPLTGYRERVIRQRGTQVIDVSPADDLARVGVANHGRARQPAHSGAGMLAPLTTDETSRAQLGGEPRRAAGLAAALMHRGGRLVSVSAGPI